MIKEFKIGKVYRLRKDHPIFLRNENFIEYQLQNGNQQIWNTSMTQGFRNYPKQKVISCITNDENDGSFSVKFEHVKLGPCVYYLEEFEEVNSLKNLLMKGKK